uniref:UBP-type domain-containing protein n=1 Tax=Arion vulgaris TaxID=1028688 RepID=A0A0B7AC38_9EUPU
MQNLIVTDTKHDSEAHELTSRSYALEASRDIKDNQIKVSQSCTQTSDHKPKQVDVSQQQQHPLSAPSSVPVTAVAWGDHPQPLTSAGEGTITADGKTQVTELGLKYPELPTESGDATGAKPKTNRYSPKSMFRSLIYGDEQDPEPLSIFVGNPLMASQEQIMIDRDRSRDQEYTLNVQSNMTEKGDRIPRELKMSNVDGAMPKSVDRIHEGATPETGDGSSCDQDHETGTRVDCELLGACGGSNNKPTTVQELIRLQGLQGVNEMHAVQPLPWCPHLTEVRPLPGSGLSLHAPCGSCGDETENWVCLTCYSVQCSRFVNEHMMMHKIETGHNVVLSFSDLSVWCYGCENYVDNELLFPMKNAAHEIKFGESLSRIP